MSDFEGTSPDFETATSTVVALLNHTDEDYCNDMGAYVIATMESMQADIDKLKAENDVLRGIDIADGMKADCNGEYYITVPAHCDECESYDYSDSDCEVCDGDYYFNECVHLNWTLVKLIYKQMHESKVKHIANTLRQQKDGE